VIKFLEFYVNLESTNGDIWARVKKYSRKFCSLPFP